MEECLAKVKKSRKILIRVRKITFFSAIVLLTVSLVVYMTSLLVWDAGFDRDMELENEIRWRNWQRDDMTEKAKTLGVVFDIPGVEGTELVTITIPRTASVWSAEYTQETPAILKGKKLTLSFASFPYRSYSLTSSRDRSIDILLEGDKRPEPFYISSNYLTDFYIAYLQQNELVSVFEEETGENLSFMSAKRALMKTDQYLYENGILKAQEYPFYRLYCQMVWVICLTVGLIMLAGFIGTLAAARFIDLTGWTDSNITDWHESNKNISEDVRFKSIDKSFEKMPAPEKTKKQLRQEKLRRFWNEEVDN